MAIVVNSATEIGDSIILELNYDIDGHVFFDSYSDSTTNESENVYWVKDFSYSIGGGDYTEYTNLDTELSATEIITNEAQNLSVKIRYTRPGS
jgi:hypothetical protein